MTMALSLIIDIKHKNTQQGNDTKENAMLVNRSSQKLLIIMNFKPKNVRRNINGDYI